MEIKLTKKQYENLIKLVYSGNWMINAIRSGAKGDERIKKYDDIEQYIFSFAEEAGLNKFIEFDKKLKEFFPTQEFELESDIDEYRQDYNNETFWEELISRLAWRDFIKKYGEKAVQKMDFEERIEKECFFEEKYKEEFAKNGLLNLEILKKIEEIL